MYWSLFIEGVFVMPRPLGGGIKQHCRVCAVWRLSLWQNNSRTESPRKTKIGIDVANVTLDSDTTFKVKRSKVKVTRTLWLVVLAGQHGHTIMVTSPYAYMTYIVSPLADLGGGISWRPPAYSLFTNANSTAMYVVVRCRSVCLLMQTALPCMLLFVVGVFVY